MKVEIEIDLEVVELDDLKEEMAQRGYACFLREEGPPLDAVDDDQLIEELRSRDIGDLAELLARPAISEWLRGANPPQEVRDAYWQNVGRIL